MEVLGPGNDNQFLFHYTSLSIALERILPRMQLQMCPFVKTSDPRENKFWNFHVTTSGAAVRDDWAVEETAWHLAERVQADLRVICLTQDKVKDNAETPIELRGFGLARMWDRYADRHRGVCLAFDRDALSRAVLNSVPNGTRLWSQPVKYGLLATNHRPEWDVDGNAVAEIGEAEIRHHIAVYYNRLLFLKSSDWQGEREYRFVYLTEPSAGPIYVPLGEAMRAVFIGCELCQGDRPYHPSFKELCRDVPVYEMRWEWGHFQKPWRI
ncbi:MAG: DUF2971 domain-containing protein [Candidatus Lambdaproteobacteria bacterium]|nr:DUF2971 domain-containing protein [Candidatus Lambdaproteobacteria bacterium]